MTVGGVADRNGIAVRQSLVDVRVPLGNVDLHGDGVLEREERRGRPVPRRQGVVRWII